VPRRQAKPVVFEDAKLTAFYDRLAEFKKTKVRIGFQAPEGKEKYESGISVAKLAAVQEFGDDDGDLPARPFMRSTIHEKAGQIASFNEAQVKLVVADLKTPTEAMGDIGSNILSLIKQKLLNAASWAEQDEPKTVAEKGSATPLRDTDKLLDALSWRVHSGRNELARGKT